MVSLDWISGHWFDLLQSVGIIGSLLFSGIVLRIDARERRIHNLFVLTKQHREIWSELFTRPELTRVLAPAVDLSVDPVTREEEILVRFLVLHLKNAFRAIEAKFCARPDGLAEDIRMFFSLPIPQSVWKSTRKFQDQDFVKFVEDTLRADPGMA
jgi:hypothetical protein